MTVADSTGSKIWGGSNSKMVKLSDIRLKLFYLEVKEIANLAFKF